jgi:hypothetical protein
MGAGISSGMIAVFLLIALHTSHDMRGILEPMKLVLMLSAAMWVTPVALGVLGGNLEEGLADTESSFSEG